MITYFKDKNKKSKKRYRKYKTLTTKLKSFDTFILIATTSGSFTLKLTGICLIAIPISTATACGLSIGNKVVYEISINKYNKFKNNIRKTNKLINLLINYTGNLYEIT